jgi:hypothetical protein
MKRRLVHLLLAAMLALVVAAPPAFAGGEYPPPPPPEDVRCNAGNGNGNEGCDPGNSTLNNRGGDETLRPLGVNGGSQDNPGGNNV